jgi:hypothetical protein
MGSLSGIHNGRAGTRQRYLMATDAAGGDARAYSSLCSRVRCRVPQSPAVGRSSQPGGHE